MVLTGKHVLVTGGTGSFGSAFVKKILKSGEDPASVTVFSRDEQKQYAMAQDLPEAQFPVRYVLGDVRDLDRLSEATANMDVVVHAAAMKHVPAAENNPAECIQTNIIGAQNAAKAALRNDVDRLVALSTDKAALPANLYGASKLCLEKIFLDADRKGRTKFSVVRYANVFGSKGSVVPHFLRLRDQRAEFLPITDPGMTRFSITMQEGIDLVLFALTEGWGGEVVLPIAPSYRILDVARAVAPQLEHRVVGIRPGEKLHEVLYSEFDAPTTVRWGNRHVICPVVGRWSVEEYCSGTGAEPVHPGRDYNSGDNTQWLSVEAIFQLVETEMNAVNEVKAVSNHAPSAIAGC